MQVALCSVGFPIDWRSNMRDFNLCQPTNILMQLSKMEKGLTSRWNIDLLTRINILRRLYSLALYQFKYVSPIRKLWSNWWFWLFPIVFHLMTFPRSDRTKARCTLDSTTVTHYCRRQWKIICTEGLERISCSLKPNIKCPICSHSQATFCPLTWVTSGSLAINCEG